MKKIMMLLLMIMVVSIVACKPVQKEAAQSGDAAVDAVGNDLNNVDAVDQDLSTDELGDLDTGLSDVENI